MIISGDSSFSLKPALDIPLKLYPNFDTFTCFKAAALAGPKLIVFTAWGVGEAMVIWERRVR
jgi:hypothetical protein